MTISVAPEFRHPELVSAPISPHAQLVRGARWVLKHCQHDELWWNFSATFLPTPSGEGIEGWGLSSRHNACLTAPTPTPPLKGRGFQ